MTKRKTRVQSQKTLTITFVQNADGGISTNGETHAQSCRKVEIGSEGWVEEIGLTMRSLRDDVRMTRPVAADKTGFNVSWLWKVETGYHPPGLTVLQAYAELFNKRLVISFEDV